MSQPNEVITELYMRMYDFLLDYAEIRLENYSLAEEAVQETFKIACLKQDALCNGVRPEGWLVNTLKNVISNMRRNQETANSKQTSPGVLCGKLSGYLYYRGQYPL